MGRKVLEESWRWNRPVSPSLEVIDDYDDDDKEVRWEGVN
jgi:hypothetical protein